MKSLRLLCLLALTAVSLRATTIGDIVADPQLWPKEVAVTAATKAGVVKNGQVAGAMLIGAGKKIVVSAIAVDGVTGKLSGTTVKVTIDQTDLLARLAAAGNAVAPAEEATTPDGGATAAEDVPPSPVQQMLFGRLVRLQNGALKPFDQRKLNGVKFYGILFSAGWCGPCREFAPHLLDSYRRLKEMYPEFELVLVSNDHSAADMLSYMREENMPWPAVKFGEIAAIKEIRRLAGPGIPCLVLIDENGQVLADSFKGSDYLGPDSVLDATWRELKKHRHG